jgi:hypothetical protein
MLLSGFIITTLYVLVALVLFGILVVDGKRWHFKAPHTAGIRELFGQFSWARIGRGNNTTGNQTQSTHSSGIKSLSGRIQTGSIGLASFGRKSNDVKRSNPDDLAITVQTIDIAPRGHPEPNSTILRPGSPRALDRGRPSDAKTLGEPKAIGLSKEGRVDIKTPVVVAPATNQNQGTVQVTGKGVPLKQLAVKMLWYPISAYPSSTRST